MTLNNNDSNDYIENNHFTKPKIKKSEKRKYNYSYTADSYVDFTALGLFLIEAIIFIFAFIGAIFGLW